VDASKQQIDSSFVKAVLKPDVKTLSPEAYQSFMAILQSEWNVHGGSVHDVYHQLRGTTKNTKAKRYQYGASFRDSPVTLAELRGFTGWYRQECPDLSYPTSADTLENWFGKYRATQQSTTKTILTVSATERGFITDSVSDGVVHFERPAS
jgi:hypothetical protein